MARYDRVASAYARRMEHYLAFVVASAIVLAIPGPTILLVVTRSLNHGAAVRRATVGGVVLGDLVAMTAAGLPQPNDGVVALNETRLPAAADFIALPIAHSQMLASRACGAQLLSFLETGRFRHDA